MTISLYDEQRFRVGAEVPVYGVLDGETVRAVARVVAVHEDSLTLDHSPFCGWSATVPKDWAHPPR